jgi:hypothetical protein
MLGTNYLEACRHRETAAGRASAKREREREKWMEQGKKRGKREGRRLSSRASDRGQWQGLVSTKVGEGDKKQRSWVSERGSDRFRGKTSKREDRDIPALGHELGEEPQRRGMCATDPCGSIRDSRLIANPALKRTGGPNASRLYCGRGARCCSEVGRCRSPAPIRSIVGMLVHAHSREYVPWFIGETRRTRVGARLLL